jgi:hypothetical protein
VKIKKWSISRQHYTACFVDSHGNEWKKTRVNSTLQCCMDGCCAKGILNDNGLSALKNGLRAGLHVVMAHNHEAPFFDARRVLLNEFGDELSEAGQRLEVLEDEERRNVIERGFYASDLNILGKSNLDIVKIFRFEGPQRKKNYQIICCSFKIFFFLRV